MISFDEAVQLIAQSACPIGQETIALSAANERVLAKPVRAMIDNPRCDMSAMDGYAVRLGDALHFDGVLSLVGDSRPGAPYQQALKSGEAVRIYTGAPLPEGADRVLVQEIVEAADGVIRLSASYGTSTHIRQKASDFSAGDELLHVGHRLHYRSLVAAGGADIGALTVFQRPRIAFIATGDELVSSGEAALHPFTIPESLSPALAVLSRNYGGKPVYFDRQADDLTALVAAAGKALTASDLVVTTGGASVGDHDHSKAMFVPHGLELIFNKVAIKPGKPVWFGRCGDKLVLGLPGNPSSALVTARLFLAPLVYGLGGGDAAHCLQWQNLPLAEQLPATGSRETFRRARLMDGAVSMALNQDSGAQSPLVQADWLVRCPAGDAHFGVGDHMAALAF